MPQTAPFLLIMLFRISSLIRISPASSLISLHSFSSSPYRTSATLPYDRPSQIPLLPVLCFPIRLDGTEYLPPEGEAVETKVRWSHAFDLNPPPVPTVTGCLFVMLALGTKLHIDYLLVVEKESRVCMPFLAQS